MPSLFRVSFQEGCMLGENDHKYSLLSTHCVPQASLHTSLQGTGRQAHKTDVETEAQRGK